mmetsp:Transcript_72891/g.202227  ORF Transcript_72891/g.202227 Transcript_72891/m.202227 type:complete len:275 (+) Transcript_72891:314-1138(+)
MLPSVPTQIPQGCSRMSGPTTTSPWSPARDSAENRSTRALARSHTRRVPSRGSMQMPVGMFKEPRPSPFSHLDDPAMVCAGVPLQDPGGKRCTRWLFVSATRSAPSGASATQLGNASCSGFFPVEFGVPASTVGFPASGSELSTAAGKRRMRWLHVSHKISEPSPHGSIERGYFKASGVWTEDLCGSAPCGGTTAPPLPATNRCTRQLSESNTRTPDPSPPSRATSTGRFSSSPSPTGGPNGRSISCKGSTSMRGFPSAPATSLPLTSPPPANL